MCSVQETFYYLAINLITGFLAFFLFFKITVNSVDVFKDLSTVFSQYHYFLPVVQTEKSAIVLALSVLFGQKCPIQHWLQGSCLCLDKGFPWCSGSRHSVKKGLPVHLHSCNIKAQAGDGFHSKKTHLFYSRRWSIGDSLQSWPGWAVVVGVGPKQSSYRLQVCFCTAGTAQQNVLLRAPFLISVLLRQVFFMRDLIPAENKALSAH